MSVGVITHLRNPSLAVIRRLAAAAEEAGADWLGLPDAFWWRDSWIAVAEALRATQRIQVGTTVTNPFMRHPLQTIASLATVAEIGGPGRVFLGLGAGGSEVTGVAGIPRDDAAERIVALVDRLRAIAGGAPRDERSDRRLEVPLVTPPVLVAGRARSILEAAGQVADRVLLWAVPTSELARSVSLIAAGAEQRAAGSAGGEGGAPELIWAPLVAHDERVVATLRDVAAYAVLNSPPRRKASWGLGPDAVARIRRALVDGGAAAASDQIPDAALDDLILCDPAPTSVAKEATRIGARGVAIPIFDVAEVGRRVEWARDVTARLAAPAAARI